MAAHELLNPTAGTTNATASLFTDEELMQFEADDQSAGSSIAKILATLFVYTVLAMLIVGWWTFRVVAN